MTDKPTPLDAEIELVLTDPDSTLSPGAVRALEYLRSQLATPASPVQSEPVAWMTEKDDPTTDKMRAERWANQMGLTVIPLHTHPPAAFAVTDADVAEAREALDSLDDFARMAVGVDAIGPRGLLERFISKVEGKASQTVEPTVKQSLTVAEQSSELDAGMAAQHYCRGLWGAARGHSDWRKVHEHFANGYKQGRYDEQMAQGPSPWPDGKPTCSHEWVNREQDQPWLVCEKCGASYAPITAQPVSQPAPVSTVPDLPAACDGKEQDAFEQWAKSDGYDMTQHPMFYIFLDKETNAARMGWNACLAYVNKTVTKRAAVGAVELPQNVLDALRFYANGEHLVIDSEAQEFDTVSGEPQNWLMSHKDGDTTMMEDGTIARQALLGGELTWVDGDEDCTPKAIKGEVIAALASKGAQA